MDRKESAKKAWETRRANVKAKVIKELTKKKPGRPVGKKSTIRSYNVGTSDYSKHKIQPWDIWEEYNLDPWDADIIKRILRDKSGEPATLDYEKIKHICDKQIDRIKRKQK